MVWYFGAHTRVCMCPGCVSGIARMRNSRRPQQLAANKMYLQFHTNYSNPFYREWKQWQDGQTAYKLLLFASFNTLTMYECPNSSRFETIWIEFPSQHMCDMSRVFIRSLRLNKFNRLNSNSRAEISNGINEWRDVQSHFAPRTSQHIEFAQVQSFDLSSSCRKK